MRTPLFRAAVSATAHVRNLSTIPSPTASFPSTYPHPSRPSRRIRRANGPYELSDEPLPSYPKRRSPLRRSTALIDALNREEALRMVVERRAVFPAKIPHPRAGDLIRVSFLPAAGHARTLKFAGIVMSVRKSGVGSTVVLRNVVEGVPVERGFAVYSPLIVDAELLGKKKVRRAKLYYLREKPLRESTFLDRGKRPAGAA